MIKNKDNMQDFIDFVNWEQDNEDNEKHLKYTDIIKDIYELSKGDYSEAFYRLADLFEKYLER